MQVPVKKQREAGKPKPRGDGHERWRGKEGQWKAWKGRPRALTCTLRQTGAVGAVLMEGKIPGAETEEGSCRKQVWMLTVGGTSV